MSGVLKSVHLRRTSSKSNLNCSVYGCTAVNRKNPELSFHTFPPIGQKITIEDGFGGKSVVERRKVWEVKLKMGKVVTPSMHVCSRHFKTDDYITPDEDCYARRFLKKTAVPTQNLPVSSLHYRQTKLQSCAEARATRINNRRKLNDEVSHEDSDYQNNSFRRHEAAEILLSLQQLPSQPKEADNTLLDLQRI